MRNPVVADAQTEPRPGSKARLWFRMFAGMLAQDRGSGIVEVEDCLAGIYIACWEKIQHCWPESTPVDRLLLEHCGLEMPRWFYWIRMYESLHNRVPGSFVAKFRRVWIERARRAPDGSLRLAGMRKVSPELQAIYDLAARKSSGSASPAPQDVLAVEPEQILQMIAEQAHLSVSKKLRESGLDIERLRKLVRGGT